MDLRTLVRTLVSNVFQIRSGFEFSRKITVTLLLREGRLSP